MKLIRCYHNQQFPDKVKTNEFYDLVEITNEIKEVTCKAKCTMTSYCRKVKCDLNDIHTRDDEK